MQYLRNHLSASVQKKYF